MEKVLLFNAPIYRYKCDIEEDYLPPLGLGYIATYLEKLNVNIKLIDCVADKLGISEILSTIEREEPNYIIINVFTQNLPLVREIVEKCNSKVSFIIGGQVVKFISSDIIKWNTKNRIDVIIGEGEFIVSAIVSNKIKDEPVEFKENKRVFKVSSNSIYFPHDITNVRINREYFKNREIINHYGEIESAMVTSRGCIYDCAFCGGARSLNNDIKVRTISNEGISSEILDIIDKAPNVRCIRILDDLFLKNRNSIINAIKIFEKFEDLSWRGMAHILTFNNAYDLLKQLKQSGCKELFVGIESGSSRIRELVNKDGSTEQLIDTVGKILQAGIDVKGYFIYGFPSETVDDFDLTFELARKLKCISSELDGNFRTSVFQFRPYHGTQLYNKIIEKYGEIMDCTLNEEIGNYNGRSQYNFQSGNFTECTLEQINEYITKTLELNSEV